MFIPRCFSCLCVVLNFCVCTTEVLLAGLVSSIFRNPGWLRNRGLHVLFQHILPLRVDFTRALARVISSETCLPIRMRVAGPHPYLHWLCQPVPSTAEHSAGSVSRTNWLRLSSFRHKANKQSILGSNPTLAHPFQQFQNMESTAQALKKRNYFNSCHVPLLKSWAFEGDFIGTVPVSSFIQCKFHVWPCVFTSGNKMSKK